jgi:hypothetical protein
MDTTGGGNYWGRVGESPAAPTQMHRFSGAGEYAGILVVMLGVWSIAASFRKKDVFDGKERRLIWFWTVVLGVSVILSWGRFDPFGIYERTIFHLPFFSSIRNPMKFMHVAHLALMILFGFGLLGFNRQYLEGNHSFTKTRANAPSFDRWWKAGMMAAVALSLLAFLIYSSAKPALGRHLMDAGFPNDAFSRDIANFSVAEVGKYFLFLCISVAVIWLIMGGKFHGKRAAWAAVILGLVLSIDLGRANTPWILYWDYTQKYASNPILDILRTKPYESRVVAPPFLVDPRGLPPEKRINQYFPSLYGIEWVQQHFQYYNIQSIDISQDPRPPADKLAYTAALAAKPGRYWQLTNTRYILGMTGFLDALNAQFDKGRNRFRIAAQFDVTPKPGLDNPSGMEDLTVTLAPDGAMALFEFTGVLPRARLFTNWITMTNDDAALKLLADETFDPSSTVVVSEVLPGPSIEGMNAASTKTEIIRYSPRRIELKTEAPVPALLLLNDRYDSDWQVTIDGQPASLLRCNFIMRGAMIPPGQHSVAFQLQPNPNAQWTWRTSLFACIVGCGLGLALFARHLFFQQPFSETIPN